MDFANFATYLQKLEFTSSRNQITEILADLFKKVDGGEIDKICYLSQGRVAPRFEAIEFGMADKMVIRAVAETYGVSPQEVSRRFSQLGDLGGAGEEWAKKDRTSKKSKMSVSEVFEALLAIAKTAGLGSVEKKISLLASLLEVSNPLSVRYLVRIPLGRLRLGFSDLTVLDALSYFLAGDKSKREEIEAAYDVRADVGVIAKTVKAKGLAGLREIKLALGTPVMPALCQRLDNAEEMIKKMGMVAAEPKYDGTRLEIHFNKGGLVRIFTRNLENVTHMFPDIVEALASDIKAEKVILDGEAIGYDPKNGKLLPFQETIKRKRKHGIGQTVKEIPLRFFCFDLLFKDGVDLLNTPFSKRRKILEKIILPSAKVIILSPQILTDKPKKLKNYHDEQIEKGLEGVVVKKWEAPYDPGRRGFTWVKFKQEKGKKGGGLTDTLDCVVMGYYRGKGKRVSFGIGAFLVGIRKRGQILTVSKIGTGLSDEQWRETKRRCEKIKVEEKPKEYKVDKNLFPDFWCKPSLVVEIEADNITKSPIHAAEYALRFPRLVRFRDDKSPDQVTTLTETEKIYKLQ